MVGFPSLALKSETILYTAQNGRSSLSATLQGRTMKHLSTAEIAVIKARILRGDKYQEIASDYRINQGWLSDLKFMLIFAEIVPAMLD